MMTSNVYIYDLIFIVLYMLNKGLGCRLKKIRAQWFPEFTGYFFWAELIMLLLYLYLRPAHTDSESLVSFFIMLFTVCVWVFIIIKIKRI